VGIVLLTTFIVNRGFKAFSYEFTESMSCGRTVTKIGTGGTYCCFPESGKMEGGLGKGHGWFREGHDFIRAVTAQSLLFAL